MDPDQGSNADRFSAYGQVLLVPENGFASLTGVAQASYDADAFKFYGLVLVAEKSLVPDKLIFDLNLGWGKFDPKQGESVSDWQPSVGLSFSPNSLWNFSADYTLDNDVNGEDSGSLAASIKLKKISSKLKLTGEKHNVYGISFSKSF